MAWVQHPGCKKMVTCALVPTDDGEDEVKSLTFDFDD